MIDIAPATYAQSRIWLDEQNCSHADQLLVAIYNMPFFYRLSPQHTLSIPQFHKSLQQLVTKHQSLRTSLTFDATKNLLMQCIINVNTDNNKLFAFVESMFETDEQLNDIIYDEKRNSQLFNLAEGLVFRCHVAFYKEISANGVLSDKDILIFNFHHALFDFPSINVFFHDLNQAYSTGQLIIDNDTALRYLDCEYEYFLFSI